MLDACSNGSRVVLALAVLFALLSIVMSARLLRYVLRETKRLRDRADLERRIVSARANPIDHERAAILPPDRHA